MAVLRIVGADEVEIDAIVFDQCADSIASAIGVSRLVKPSVRLLRESFGIDSNKLVWSDSGNTRRTMMATQTGTEPRAAELFRTSDSLLILLLEQGRSSLRRTSEGLLKETQLPKRLRLVEFGTGAFLSFLDDARTAVETILGYSLVEMPYKNTEFDQLISDGEAQVASIFTPEELLGSQLLRARDSRALAQAIKASRGLLVSDMTKQLSGDGNEERAENSYRALIDSGLVQSEYVVVCRERGTQANARMPRRELVEMLDETGVRCGCGRKLSDERIEEAASITDVGIGLLDGSRWMSILVAETFANCGVPRDRIILEHVEGGEEYDCIADISGELTLLELKDKEFSLGNAYSFGAKTGIIKPRHAVIVTTEKVGGDARDHFERSKLANRRAQPFSDEIVEPDINFIEGLEDLETQLDTLVSGIFHRDAVGFVGRTVPFFSLSPSEILNGLAK